MEDSSELYSVLGDPRDDRLENNSSYSSRINDFAICKMYRHVQRLVGCEPVMMGHHMSRGPSVCIPE